MSLYNVPYHLDFRGNCVVIAGSDRRKMVSFDEPSLNIIFSKKGKGLPSQKRYLRELKNDGRVIGTYWESKDILDEPFSLALTHEESGHNDSAKRLIKAIIGGDIVFDTPKPLKLTKQLIHILCPKDGIVLDAFGGSATTAHAVLDLNNSGDSRRFIIIELGEYADSIAAERVRRVIDGNWAYPRKDTIPLGGSFVYLSL